MDQVFAYKGYFVGAFAQRVGDGQYRGCASICSERPERPEAPNALERLYSVGIYDDTERAIKAASHQARQVIDGLGQNWDPFTAPGAINSR
ncbi:MAG TPA: hypothetical protein VK996_20190 [Ramlibacter sp.]|jgi:hypothetical protein|nr:hypothetical protein [Ramlibacter sp.]